MLDLLLGSSQDYSCWVLEALVKQHLSAIRMLFDYLVTGHVVPFNTTMLYDRRDKTVKRGVIERIIL